MFNYPYPLRVQTSETRRGPKVVLRKENVISNQIQQTGALSEKIHEITKTYGPDHSFMKEVFLKDSINIKIKKIIDKYSKNDRFSSIHYSSIADKIVPYVEAYIDCNLKHREAFCCIMHYIILNVFFSQSELKDTIVNDFIAEVCTSCTDVYEN